MSETNKPYKCVYCGRFFTNPVPHKCKDGFRKHNLEFNIITDDDTDPLSLVGLTLDELMSAFDEHKPLQESAKKLYEKMDKTKLNSPLSSQVGGDHYKKYKIQPIEFAMANNLNACQFSILKYVLRYKDKNGLEDLKKARHFLDILIETEYPNHQNE